VHLDHATFPGPGEVIRLWRHEEKRPCRQFVSLGFIEFVAQAKVDSARDNSGVLDVRMPVRRNLVSGWKREPDRDRALLCGITLENGQLRARGQRRRAVFPLDGPWGEDAMVGGRTLLALRGNCCEEHKPAKNYQRVSEARVFSHFRFLADRYAVSGRYDHPPLSVKVRLSMALSGRLGSV